MKKILIADDDTAIADLLTQALAEEGYETFKESQSLRVYDAVREHQPDLILLDLMMPYLDGRDELELLRLSSDTGRIPVIIVTARTEAKQEEEEYKKLGVVTIVTKPFDLNQLVRLVKRTLGA
ncbi:MAG: response regulator [Ktedonobacterales bacterium]|nr:response regulator [Ktedonobacterales bacterium]